MEEQGTSNEKEEVGECQVCEQAGHGIHFGVLSCRACAAFFRRTVVCDRQYPCRRGDNKCKIEKGSRIICRKCRYDKCVRLGMTQDNVQYNRDRMGSSKPCSSKQAAEQDKEAQKDVAKPDPKRSLGLESLVTPISRPSSEDIFERLEHFFSNFNPATEISGIWEETPLNRMHLALVRHRRDQVMNVHDLKYIEEINYNNMRQNWEPTMFKVAEWYMFCREFYILPFEQKLLVFQERWKVFMRLERLIMSVQFFGPDVLRDKIVLLSNNTAASVKDVKLDLSAISDYDSSYLRRFFEPIVDNIFEKVVTPLVQYNLAPTEVIYLLSQLSFHVEGLELPYETIDSFVAFRDHISDDLHNYYISVGMPNYANRLMDILSICQAMESVQTQREQIMDLIKIFDFIRVDDCQPILKKKTAK